MTGRVRRLVKVDDTGADVGLQITLERGSASRNRGEVAGANKHCVATLVSQWFKVGDEVFFFSHIFFSAFPGKRTFVVVLEEKRPFLSRDIRANRLGLNGVVHVLVLDGGHGVEGVAVTDQKFVRGNFASAAAPTPNLA